MKEDMDPVKGVAIILGTMGIGFIILVVIIAIVL